MQIHPRIVLSLVVVAMLGACAQRAPVLAQEPASQAPRVASANTQYGVVSGVETVSASQTTTGTGALIGGVVGAVIGRQFAGTSNGRATGTALGAVTGALLGNEAERHNTGTQPRVRISVQMDSGNTAQFEYGQAGGLRVGDRVRIENNQLYRL